MKIELNENKVFFNNGESVQEIHPFWLRERVDGDEFLDKGTQQRLFDPSTMNGEIIIKKAQIKNGFLEVDFNDGVNSKLDINKLESEFSNKDTVIKSILRKKWDSTLKNIKNFEYKENFFESREMYDLLVSFYEFGFVIVKNVPTEIVGRVDLAGKPTYSKSEESVICLGFLSSNDDSTKVSMLPDSPDEVDVLLLPLTPIVGFSVSKELAAYLRARHPVGATLD